MSEIFKPRKVGSARVVTDAEAGQLAPEDVGADLPPAGNAREEELKRRVDELQAKIDSLTNADTGVDRQAFDAAKLDRDNEILQFIERGSFPVKNADEVYEYCGVQRDQFGKFGGIHVFKKKAQGWEMCRYDNPEQWGVRSPEGYCVIGDVVLMRVRKDIYLKLHRRGQQIADLRRSAADHELRQVGDKSRSKGIIATTDEEVDPKTLQRMSNKAEARRKANQITDQWIKEGRMPGVNAPGRG